MNTDRSRIRTALYEPDSAIKKGYAALYGEVWSEIISNRWLIYQLIRREFVAKYKQSLTGVLWMFLFPVISIGTFLVLIRSGILSFDAIAAPYEIFAAISIALWQLFSTGLIAASNSLIDAGPMVVKINFSKKSLVVASMGQAVISFSLYLIVAGLISAWHGHYPYGCFLLMPLLILPLLFLTFGFGLVFSLLNGITRDIGNILSVMMTFLMFLTPVLYPKPASGLLSSMNRYNPLYYLIALPRELFLYGASGEWTGFLISSVVSVIVCLVAVMVFHLTETRVAERI